MERDFGEQPIIHILVENSLNSRDLITASTENITYKMISRACKGRRLTPHVQERICKALNTTAGTSFLDKDLFNY